MRGRRLRRLRQVEADHQVRAGRHGQPDRVAEQRRPGRDGRRDVAGEGQPAVAARRHRPARLGPRGPADVRLADHQRRGPELVGEPHPQRAAADAQVHGLPDRLVAEHGVARRRDRGRHAGPAADPGAGGRVGRGPAGRAGGVRDAGGQRAGQHQGAGRGQRGLGADHRISSLPVRAGRRRRGRPGCRTGCPAACTRCGRGTARARPGPGRSAGRPGSCSAASRA